MNAKRLCAVAAIWVFVSCVPLPVTTRGSYIRLISPSAGPMAVSETDAAKVQIFFQKDPDFAYTEVGIVEAMAYGDHAGLGDLFPELKKQALLAGGQAVCHIQLSRQHPDGELLHATAIAIVPR